MGGHLGLRKMCDLQWCWNMRCSCIGCNLVWWLPFREGSPLTPLLWHWKASGCSVLLSGSFHWSWLNCLDRQQLRIFNILLLLHFEFSFLCLSWSSLRVGQISKQVSCSWNVNFARGGVRFNLELIKWLSKTFFLPPLGIVTEFRRRGVLFMIKWQPFTRRSNRRGSKSSSWMRTLKKKRWKPRWGVFPKGTVWCSQKWFLTWAVEVKEPLTGPKNEHRWLMGGRALPAGGSAGLFLSPMGHLYTSAKRAVQTRDKTLERCDCSVFWEAFPPLPAAGTMLVLWCPFLGHGSSSSKQLDFLFSFFCLASGTRPVRFCVHVVVMSGTAVLSPVSLKHRTMCHVTNPF